MPTTPASPDSSAAVDRLALGIDSPRGAEASHGVVALPFACFEAEVSSFACICCCGCFEVETSGIPGGCFACSCFETE